MDTPHYPRGSSDLPALGRPVTGQVRFNFGTEFQERIIELYHPEFHEDLHKKPPLLSSRYTFDSERFTGNRLRGNDEQRAYRIKNALAQSTGGYQNKVSRYMQIGSAQRGSRIFHALQFGIHLHPLTIDQLAKDELVDDGQIFSANNESSLLVNRKKVLSAIHVIEDERMLEGSKRARALHKLVKFVTNDDFLSKDTQSLHEISPNRHAHVINARLQFKDKHP